MSFRSSQGARVYVGILSAAAYARSVDTSSSTDMHDVTTLADRAKVFMPLQETSTFSIAGPLDTDATSNGQWDALTDVKGSETPQPITYLPLGSDGHGWLFEAIETEIGATSSVTASVDWNLSAQTTGQTDFNGVILSDAAITADTNGSSVDNGAGTSNGAVFHLHVTGFSGLTSDAITVQQSATGSFSGEQTTVATFTTVTGLTSQRLAVTGSVGRYLRVVDDVTGTGTCTRFVAVARR